MQQTAGVPPFPDAERIARLVAYHFATEPPKVPAKQGPLYNIREHFGKFCRYWIDKVQFNRFGRDSVLYRDGVTNALFQRVQYALDRGPGTGIIVKGPQGIGKSHSLVNLVLKLLSTKQYLVTFIPNCEAWTSSTALMEAICASFGAKLQDVGYPPNTPMQADIPERDLGLVVNAVDEALANEGKQWVFVFDQINKVMERYPDKGDIGLLPFPYFMMQGVLLPGRIISIVSASTSNEIGQIESHRSFTKYAHVANMTRAELATLFEENPAIVDGGVSLERATEVAGGVPLYMKTFLEDPIRFEDKLYEEVGESIRKLQGDKWRWHGPKEEYHLQRSGIVHNQGSL
jgi:hypothetical protein